MTPEQYLDTHRAEVFAKIAEAMGALVTQVDYEEDICYGRWHTEDSFQEVNPLTNAEHRWELAVFLFKEAYIKNQTYIGQLSNCFITKNPPRELVLVAMDMLGVNHEDYKSLLEQRDGLKQICDDQQLDIEHLKIKLKDARKTALEEAARLADDAPEIATAIREVAEAKAEWPKRG